MFEDIEIKNWKQVFHFKNTKESMLHLKYTNRWFFPVMLAMTMILMFMFMIFVIGFFVLEQSQLSNTIYLSLVFLFIVCWSIFYFIIQKRAIAPYSPNTNGYLIFTEDKIIVKFITEKNVQECEYLYDIVDKIYFNKRTCGLAIVDKSNNTIFNELIAFEDVSNILNLLYILTNKKPRVI